MPSTSNGCSTPNARCLRRSQDCALSRRGFTCSSIPSGVRSAQRLALSGFGGGLVVALWPCELKPQAEYLYGQRLATPMIARARELGWTVAPNPHLAFRNSSPGQRLYMGPRLDAAEYAGRWENGDLGRVGQYQRDEVRRTLWPWLLDRGYAEPGDEGALDAFLDTQLGNRPAFLRPGLFFKRYWDSQALAAAGGIRGAASTIRDEVNAILASGHEPDLPDIRDLSTGASQATSKIVAPAAPETTSRGTVRAPIPERVRHEVWRRDQGRCVDCHSRERLEFDHIIPISRGGSNTARNLELRCEACNRRKSARI